MSKPTSIWIDTWGGNWSPSSGGTQRHKYVSVEIHSAEIDRLEKEVERLKGYGIDAVSAAYDRGSKYAWNEAIEAAAAEAENCDYPWFAPTNEMADAANSMAERIAYSIRALKRSQE